MACDQEWLHFENDEPLYITRYGENKYASPTKTRSALLNVKNVKLRDEDILICSFPKSGVHWLWENVRMLISGEIITDKRDKEETFMESFEIGYFDNIPSPRIFTNHMLFEDQPKDILKGKTKLLMIYRNPKDICVSDYFHLTNIPIFRYESKFSNFIHRFMQGKIPSGRYLDYLKSFETGLKANPNIPYLLMRYEDLIKNPIYERQRLTQFLGKEYDDEFLQRVAEKTSFDNMKKNKSTTTGISPYGTDVFYRKGKVGAWKDHFTVQQSEMFDNIIAGTMPSSSMFEFVYSLDERESLEN